jgi:hypothetical protein
LEQKPQHEFALIPEAFPGDAPFEIKVSSARQAVDLVDYLADLAVELWRLEHPQQATKRAA